MKYKNHIYIVNPENDAEVNAIGSDIISFIRSSPPQSSLNSLLNSLMTRYAVSKSTLQKDVREFLDACVRKDILLNFDLIREGENVLREIRSIQEKIPELSLTQFGYCAVLNQPLSPGCQSCREGKWAVFNVCSKCDLECFSCPYGIQRKRCFNIIEDCRNCESIFFLNHCFRSFRDLKFQFDLFKDQFNAIAWIGGEPLMPHALKKILPLMHYFQKTYPTYHQWIYTNGLHATRPVMQKLYRAGIREIRFNLAAVNFSRKIIKRMKEAKKIFPYICLEIAMTKESYQGLLRHKKAILDTKLNQINLAEYMIGAKHFSKEKELKKEGRLYNYILFITSPISSRQYTYKIIKTAIKEKWPVVINDCSNEYKFYKLAIQTNKPVKVFKGIKDYWDNNFPLSRVDSFNKKSK